MNKIFQVFKSTLIEAFLAIKKAFLSFIRFQFRLSLLLVRFIVKNPFFYALYFCLFLCVTLLSTTMLESPMPWPIAYLLSVSLFAEIQESALDICLIYWIPRLKTFIESLLGACLIEETLGNVSIRELFVLIFMPVILFYVLILADAWYGADMVTQDAIEYIQSCKDDPAVISQKLNEIHSRHYSILDDTRAMIATFIKSLFKA